MTMAMPVPSAPIALNCGTVWIAKLKRHHRSKKVTKIKREKRVVAEEGGKDDVTLLYIWNGS